MSSLRRDDEIASRALGRFYGKYPAVVVENDDPDQQYRVQMRCECLFPSDILDPVITDWALPSQPMGFFFIPAIGDEVWLEFQQGHPDFPVWSSKLQDPDGPSQLGTPIGASASANNYPTDDSDVSDGYPFVHALQSVLGNHYLLFGDLETNLFVKLKSQAGLLEFLDTEDSAKLSFDSMYLSFDVASDTLELTDGASSMIMDTTGTKISSAGDASINDVGGAKLNLSEGLVALGNEEGELLDLVNSYMTQSIQLATQTEMLAAQAALIVVPTAVGPSSVPTNAAAFTAVATAAASIVTAITALQTQLGLVMGSL